MSREDGSGRNYLYDVILRHLPHLVSNKSLHIVQHHEHSISHWSTHSNSVTSIVIIEFPTSEVLRMFCSCSASQAVLTWPRLATVSDDIGLSRRTRIYYATRMLGSSFLLSKPTHMTCPNKTTTTSTSGDKTQLLLIRRLLHEYSLSMTSGPTTTRAPTTRLTAIRITNSKQNPLDPFDLHSTSMQ